MSCLPEGSQGCREPHPESCLIWRCIFLPVIKDCCICFIFWTQFQYQNRVSIFWMTPPKDSSFSLFLALLSRMTRVSNVRYSSQPCICMASACQLVDMPFDEKTFGIFTYCSFRLGWYGESPFSYGLGVSFQLMCPNSCDSFFHRTAVLERASKVLLLSFEPCLQLRQTTQ